MTREAEDLWGVAVALYARPEVEAACLALQDEAGVDITLLLFAAWAGVRRGVALTPERLQALDESLAPWREEVTMPLRRLRRAMKTMAPPHKSLEHPALDLRGRIKACELESERLALDALAAHAGFSGPMAPPIDPAVLRGVLQAVTALPGTSVAAGWRDRHLDTLVDAAFSLAMPSSQAPRL